MPELFLHIHGTDSFRQKNGRIGVAQAMWCEMLRQLGCFEEVSFHPDFSPNPGSLVFVWQSRESLKISTPDMLEIGTSSTRTGTMPLSSGVARIVNSNTVELHYIGPIVT